MERLIDHVREWNAGRELPKWLKIDFNVERLPDKDKAMPTRLRIVHELRARVLTLVPDHATPQEQELIRDHAMQQLFNHLFGPLPELVHRIRYATLQQDEEEIFKALDEIEEYWRIR